MKKTSLVLVLLISTVASYSQFSDTVQLNTFILDTIRDRRPDRVTAAQVQKAMLGISKFLTPNVITQAGQGLTKEGNIINAGGTFEDDLEFEGIGDEINFKVTNANEDFTNSAIFNVESNNIGCTVRNFEDGYKASEFNINESEVTILNNNNEKTNAYYFSADSFNIENQIASVFRISNDGLIRTVYKNNATEDSILITDNKGNLKLKLNSIRRILIYDFPSLPANSSTSTSITIQGAVIGDIVDITTADGNAWFNGESYTGWVSSPNTVTIRLNNNSGTFLDVGNRTYHIMVRKFYNEIYP